jgi:hypothetical protein
VFRFVFTMPLFFIQLPLVLLDTIVGGRHYGRPKWSFLERAMLLLGSYSIWSSNPGTRPADDVVSYAARSHPGKLRGKRRAKLIDVPARPDKLFGDAVYQGMTPEKCPCFWMWVDGDMISPVVDPTLIGERKVMMYFVGGGMVQGSSL